MKLNIRSNEDLCPPQVKGKMEHFVARKAMNIDSLGAETIAQLYEAGLLKNIADIYDLEAVRCHWIAWRRRARRI